MARRFFAVLAILCAGAGTALAQDDPFTPAQREALDDRIRSYLLENPELFLEVFDLLEQRRLDAQADADAALVAEYADRLRFAATSPVMGNPEGDVTIVKFSDYRCGFCKSAATSIEQLVASDPGVRVVIKEFPILGEESVTAGRVALAAAMQGEAAFTRLHLALMGFGGQLDGETTFALAEQAGLDTERLRADIADPVIAEEIRANYALARALGIEGTPTFVIGDRIVRQMIPLDRMRALVAEARGERG
jgi:protein-disulfide isomerase